MSYVDDVCDLYHHLFNISYMDDSKYDVQENYRVFYILDISKTTLKIEYQRLYDYILINVPSKVK